MCAHVGATAYSCDCGQGSWIHVQQGRLDPSSSCARTSASFEAHPLTQEGHHRRQALHLTCLFEPFTCINLSVSNGSAVLVEQNGSVELLEGAVDVPVVCPLTLREAGMPKWPFVMIVPCGCVVSESAYNQFYLENTRLDRCAVCGNKENFDRKAMIRLDMNEEQFAAAQAQVKESLAKAKQLRKRARKESAEAASPAPAAAAAAASEDAEPAPPPDAKKAKKDEGSEVAAKDLFVTEGANLEVYKSLFTAPEVKKKQETRKLPGTGSDLFLAQSGKGGVL